jgi:hypothetical protein
MLKTSPWILLHTIDKLSHDLRVLEQNQGCRQHILLLKQRIQEADNVLNQISTTDLLVMAAYEQQRISSLKSCSAEHPELYAKEIACWQQIHDYTLLMLHQRKPQIRNNDDDPGSTSSAFLLRT